MCPSKRPRTRWRWFVAAIVIAMIVGCKMRGTSDQEAVELGILLMKACWDANAALAELLIKDGADPNTTDENGVTALMLAASNPRGDNGQLVNILVDRGADVNARIRKDKQLLRRLLTKVILAQPGRCSTRAPIRTPLMTRGKRLSWSMRRNGIPTRGTWRRFFNEGYPSMRRIKTEELRS
jgi:ankyrin repeat protein